MTNLIKYKLEVEKVYMVENLEIKNVLLVILDGLFGTAFEKRFSQNLIFFLFRINMFLMFSNHFDVLISKIIF